MWYINNSKTNHEVDSSFYKFAQSQLPKKIWNPPWPKREYKPDYSDLSKIKQIDETYFGVYDSNGRLIAVMPVYFGGNGVNNPGVKLNPSLISGLKINDDSYNFMYPTSTGQTGLYFASLDQQSILPRYLKQQLDEMGLRTDFRGDAERMKNEEKKLNSMYFQFVNLANNFLKQGFSKNKIKEDLYFRILNLVQTGQIDEQTGMTLNAWLGKLESLDTRSVEEKSKAVFNDLNNKIGDPNISKKDLLKQIDESSLTEDEKKELKFYLEKHHKSL